MLKPMIELYLQGVLLSGKSSGQSIFRIRPKEYPVTAERTFLVRSVLQNRCQKQRSQKMGDLIKMKR